MQTNRFKKLDDCATGALGFRVRVCGWLSNRDFKDNSEQLRAIIAATAERRPGASTGSNQNNNIRRPIVGPGRTSTNNGVPIEASVAAERSGLRVRRRDGNFLGRHYDAGSRPAVSRLAKRRMGIRVWPLVITPMPNKHWQAGARRKHVRFVPGGSFAGAGQGKRLLRQSGLGFQLPWTGTIMGQRGTKQHRAGPCTRFQPEILFQTLRMAGRRRLTSLGKSILTKNTIPHLHGLVDRPSSRV